MKIRRSKSLWKSSSFSILAVLMIFLLGQTALAAGSVSLKADKASVSVGDEITLTLKASGASGAEAPDITVKYDSRKLSFVSCNQNYGGGGGGLITLRDMSATIKLKASAQGSAQVSVEAILDGDGVDVPTDSVSIEIGGTGSGGNGLKTLNVTEGALSPAFSSGVKEYTMTVPASVTSVAVSAVPADDGAKVSAVTGFNDLAFGENEGVVTVTEKDGSQIDYHVIITRSESDEPVEEGVILDDLIPLADGSLSVSTTFPEDVLPKGFVKTEISYEERMVEAARLEMGELYLLYMTDASGGNEFYVYDQDTGKISDFIQFFSIEDKFIVLLEPDDTVSAPDGFVKAELRYGGKVITGWAPASELGTQEASATRPSSAEAVLGDIYAGVAKVLYVHAQEPEMLMEDTSAEEGAPVADEPEGDAAPDGAEQGEPEADAPAEGPSEAPAQTEPEGSEGVTADTGFVLVYAMNSEGQKGLYIYDKLEGTYQRYLMSGAGGSAGGGAGGLLSGGGDFESQAKQRFIIICILAVVIVVLLLVILNMFLRLREYKRNDEEVYEEDEEFLPPAGKDRLKAVKKEKVKSRRGRDEMDYLLDKADTADDDEMDDDDPEDDEEEDDDSIVFGSSKPKRRSSQKRPTFDDIEIVVPEGLFSRKQKEESGEVLTETKKVSAKKQDKKESGKESKKAAKKAGRRGARQEDEWEWEAIVQEAEQAEELKSEKRPKPKQKAAPEPETAPEPKLKAVAKQEPGRKPKAEPKPAPDPEPKPEPKPVPKPEPEPELDLDEDFEFEFIDLDD